MDECQVLRSPFGKSSSGSKRTDGHFNRCERSTVRGHFQTNNWIIFGWPNMALDMMLRRAGMGIEHAKPQAARSTGWRRGVLVAGVGWKVDCAWIGVDLCSGARFTGSHRCTGVGLFLFSAGKVYGMTGSSSSTRTSDGIVELTADLSGSPYYSHDMAPVPARVGGGG